jgi:hypothetical protein
LTVFHWQTKFSHHVATKLPHNTRLNLGEIPLRRHMRHQIIVDSRLRHTSGDFMKQFLRGRTLLALAITTGLSACGGGGGQYDLGGLVSGLTDAAGVTLVNGDKTVTVAANATAYFFQNKLDYGDVFNVTIPTQPVHQTCSLGLSTGSAGTTSTISANLFCQQNAYPVGGTIRGLKAAGLMLNNGSDVSSVTVVTTPPTDPLAFSFPVRVLDGAVYGVTILAQPPGQVCTVAEGTGTGRVGIAAVTSVVVNCVDTPAVPAGPNL